MSEGTFKSSNMHSAYKKELKMSEGKFKVGDWVTISTTRKTEQVLGVDSNFVYTKTSYYKINLCELWTPKQGEWCLFWNREEDLTIQKFHKKQQDYFIVAFCEKHKSDGLIFYDVTDKHFKNCAPFTGELPTF